MTQIHILDQQTDKIFDSTTTFWDDNHRETLTKEEFDFSVSAKSRIAQYLTKRNRIIIPVDDGFFREFIINRVRLLRGEKVVNSIASYTELNKCEPIAPTTLNGATVNTAMDFILQKTGWKRGITDYSGTRTVKFEEHIKPYEALKKISNVDTFNLELRFRIEVNGNQITRLVDMVKKVGEWRGREIVSGKDLINVERMELLDDVVTALRGIGPQKDDGTFEVVEVKNDDARQVWGRVNEVGIAEHLWDIYIPQTDNADMDRERLTQLTETELQKRISATVQYIVDGADIESIFGREHEKIRLGDSVRVKATEYSPPIYLDSRIISREGSIRKNASKKYVLGEFIERTEEDIKANLKLIEKQVARKISLVQLEQYAEPKKVISETPPEDNSVIWIKPTDSIYVPYAYDDIKEDWEKMSPSSAEEINGVEKNKDYNGTKISDIDGMISTSKDKLVRVILNAEYGFIAQQRRSVAHPWENILFFDFNDKLYKFSGGVEGVTGTFAQVSVKNGDLLLEDETTGTKTIIRGSSNMIFDHSFEYIRPQTSVIPINNSASVFTVDPASLSSLAGHWNNTSPSNARIMVSLQGSTHTMHGQRAAVLRGQDFGMWDQHVLIPEQVKQTRALSLSAYVAPFEQTTYDVTVSVRLQLVDSTGRWIRDLANKSFVIDHTKKYNWSRVDVSFTGDLQAKEGDMIRARLFLENNTTSAMLLCDAVQIVPFAHPTFYDPESGLFRLTNGYDTAEELNTRNLHADYASANELFVLGRTTTEYLLLNDATPTTAPPARQGTVWFGQGWQGLGLYIYSTKNGWRRLVEFGVSNDDYKQ